MKKFFNLAQAFGSKKIRFFEIDAPHPADERHGIAIAAIVLNVSSSIAEWIDFHRLAGARHFYIYDNGSTDETKELLNRPALRDFVTLLPWRFTGRDSATGRRISSQVSAYAHAIQTFGAHYERMAFIDIDEFLVPRSSRYIMDALRVAGDFSNVSLPWHMFGHNGHRIPPSGGVINNYTLRAKVPYRAKSSLLRFKCIVDPCKVTKVGVHSFETIDMDDRTANTDGLVVSNARRKSPDFFTSKNLQLNHYYLLSEEEFQQKLKRGPVNYADALSYQRRVSSKKTEIEREVEEDFSAIEFFQSSENTNEQH